MQTDDETTGKELVSSLSWNGVSISKTTALKGRKLLGWTRRGTAYCQLIRAVNCVKRLEWAQQNLGETFEDVVWSDETSVQLETHRRFHCYNKGQKPRYKPSSKAPSQGTRLGRDQLSWCYRGMYLSRYNGRSIIYADTRRISCAVY